MDEELEKDVHEVIAACDGDLRAVLRTLVIANRTTEEALRQMEAAVSRGYRRKKAS